MVTRVKICGIRSTADLHIAVDAGADAIGFISGVTHHSEDALTPHRARELVAITPPYVSTVLVTHLVQPDEIVGLANFLGVDTIQLHGLITADSAESVFAQCNGRRRITRVVHVTDEDAIDRAVAAIATCHAIHLDSRTADRLGGTGLTHDWSISRTIVETMTKSSLPVILSGGLTPLNVAMAIATVRPFAVDANSGLEDAAGDKDPDLCRRFVSIGCGLA